MISDDETHNTGGDALDRLLAEARWPEADEVRVWRLKGHWIRVSRSMRVGSAWLLGITAAALFLATGAAWWHWGIDGRGDRLVNNDIPGRVRGNAEVQQPDLADSRPDKHGVAPNDYERLVVFVAQRRHSASPPPGPDPAELAVVRQAIDDLAAKPELEIREVAEQLDPARHEPLLWAEIARSQDKRLDAAARLLAQVGTWRSLPLLNQLAERPQTRAASIEGLARLAAPQDLARLAVVETEPLLRQRLAAGLLERGTPESVRYYLNLARGDEDFTWAVAAVDRVESPPVDLLFGYLAGNDVSLRMPAARALGRIDDPRVAARLEAHVVANVGRHEALVALLSCTERGAGEFLGRARHDLYLVAAVRAAEWQFHSLAIHAQLQEQKR